jgi:mannose-1-phosphate guanylyltransferase/mannose-6-phosphate isomerase
MKMDIIINPVVMAGGVGSRLWPLSRAAFPKQYQVLVENDASLTMLQQTFARLGGLSLGISQLICNQRQRFLAAEQVRRLGDEISACAGMTPAGLDIVLEPCGRNTAPAVIIAALRLLQQGMDHPMLVLSADHAIADEERFRATIVKASALANKGYVVTLGIQPSFACTGYGYIECGGVVGVGSEQGLVVNNFIEKPDETTAADYLASNNYLWNSGMFMMRPSVVIEEAEAYCPVLLAQCRATVASATLDLDFVRLPEAQFAQCDNISIDYAIMEHTQKAVVVPMDCGWSDVGDLNALYETNTRDYQGNVCQGDTLVNQSHNCFVKSTSRLIAAQGVEGLAIVETKDAVLVVPLAQAQDIKQLVTQLKLQQRDELLYQREVHRPWGSYDSVDSGANYQVKRISVNPKARLSLQRHQFRAEHWVVVQGQAKVHVDGQDQLLNANDSIYIPKGAVHCLANETDEVLHLVEVQSGSYLGEDDIERLDDIYGRN